jgi:hypothetical protein
MTFKCLLQVALTVLSTFVKKKVTPCIAMLLILYACEGKIKIHSRSHQVLTLQSILVIFQH